MIESHAGEPRLFDTGSLIAGRYEVVSTVGSGSMGWVLHAIDRTLNNKSIALKLLHPHLVQDKKTFARFQNEVLVTRELNHPNIVRVYDMGSTENGLFYITMEYVHGTSLKDLIYDGSGKGMPFPDAVRLLYQIAEGIAHAHSNGVVHRDLKPDNILVSRLGEVKIVDFGIARSLWQDHGLTKTGGAVGTPYYMAPEQIRGQEVDHRADIYSLGIIAYELVTGTRPFNDECFFNLAQQHFEAEVPDLATSTSGIPPWYHELVKRCAAKLPEDRYNSTEELADLLKAHAPTGLYKPQRRLAGRMFSGVVEGVNKRFKDLREKIDRFAVLYVLVPWVLFFFLASAVGTATFWIFAYTNSTIRAQTMWPLLRAERYFGTELATLKELFNVRISSEEHTQLLSIDRPKDLFDAVDGGVENEGDKFAIRLLMLAGMDPNTRHLGRTALEYAVARGRVKAINELLRYRADPNIPDEHGRTRLFEALRRHGPSDVLLLLKSPRLDITARDEAGNTLLHAAVKLGHVEIARHLLRRGADPRARNDKGEMPLFIAVAQFDWEPRIVHMLIDQFEYETLLELRDGRGRSLLEATPPINRIRLENILQDKKEFS